MESPSPGSWPQMLRPLAVILFIELFSYGLCLRQLGFYMEDWNHLELTATGGGLWAGIRQLIVTGYSVRPVAAPLRARAAPVGKPRCAACGCSEKLAACAAEPDRRPWSVLG